MGQYQSQAPGISNFDLAEKPPKWNMKADYQPNYLVVLMKMKTFLISLQKP
jgi:hypothetical protein